MSFLLDHNFVGSAREKKGREGVSRSKWNKEKEKSFERRVNCSGKRVFSSSSALPLLTPLENKCL